MRRFCVRYFQIYAHIISLVINIKLNFRQIETKIIKQKNLSCIEILILQFDHQ